MSSRLRAVLLCGCGLIASIEAPRAGAWLTAGLVGPYPPTPSVAPALGAVAPARDRSARDSLPRLKPALILLSRPGAAEEAPLAMGR